jgi:adenylosuccinate synthase
MQYFEERLRGLAKQIERSYPGLKVDVDEELKYYHSIRDQVLAMVTDTVYMSNQALAAQKKILVEGANATSKSHPFLILLLSLSCTSFNYFSFISLVIDLDLLVD